DGEHAGRAGGDVVKAQGVVGGVQAGLRSAVLEVDQPLQAGEGRQLERHLEGVVVGGGQGVAEAEALVGEEGVVGGVQGAAVGGQVGAAQGVGVAVLELVVAGQRAGGGDAGAEQAEGGGVLDVEHAGHDGGGGAVGVGAREH